MAFPVISEWWWQRGHRKDYASEKLVHNPFALNTGTKERFEALVEELKTRIAPKSQDSVLDMGGGNGVMSRAVFGHCQSLILTDLNWECLERQNRSEDPMLAVRADMTALPFKNAAFDILFTYSTFPHIRSSNALRILESCDRLLKKGGTLYLGDIPDRRTIPRMWMDSVPRFRERGWLRGYFAFSLLCYHTPGPIVRRLEKMGYRVELIEQPMHRRFHRYRFDIKATKQ